MQRLLTVVAALGVAISVSACVVEPVNPHPPPPPLRAELVPPAPGGQVWEPGHWHWNGGAYAWVPGHYIARHPGWNRFVHGHWQHQGGAWVWVPGHWV